MRLLHASIIHVCRIHDRRNEERGAQQQQEAPLPKKSLKQLIDEARSKDLLVGRAHLLLLLCSLTSS